MTFMTVFQLLRVSQYTKNLFVFLPLFFSGLFFEFDAFMHCFIIFTVFCCISSIVYILNDIRDIQEDRRHPTKKNRPIAAGLISIKKAIFVAGALVPLAAVLFFFGGNAATFLTVSSYFFLNLFYIYIGKQKAILDVACISLGFVLRASAGALAISQDLSQWLVLMVFLLCMFLGLGKRWDDLCLSETEETFGKIRSSIDGYSKKFVLAAMTFLSAINTVCYIMYTVASDTQNHYHSSLLYLTSVWVVLGNMRYLQLAFVENKSASPTRVLLHDRGIQFCVLAWFTHLTFLLYL